MATGGEGATSGDARNEVDSLWETASSAFRRGNLQLAEFACRDLLERRGGHAGALLTLAHIAEQVGRPDVAIECCKQVLRWDPSNLEAQVRVGGGAASVRPRRKSPENRARYLLIKAWGNGLWSDVDHVAGQLVLAEITGRTPIVHWGRNSLFCAAGFDNAYEAYFAPVSDVGIGDVTHAGWSYFPAKWDHSNLHRDDHNKWSGAGSRVTGLYALGRDEDVVVSDFYTALNDLIPWIPSTSQFSGMRRTAIYRHLFRDRIRVAPRLIARAEAFWSERMAGHRWLAVHVRGSDKTTEQRDLAEVNRAYFGFIDPLLAAQPDLGVFLLTDSEPAVRAFRSRYGDRVLHTDCLRSSTLVGVHLSGHDGQRVAGELILDTILASRCDLFLGNGGSNVSTTVSHLKEWPRGTTHLMGPNVLTSRHWSFHDR